MYRRLLPTGPSTYPNIELDIVLVLGRGEKTDGFNTTVRHQFFPVRHDILAWRWEFEGELHRQDREPLQVSRENTEPRRCCAWQSRSLIEATALRVRQI